MATWFTRAWNALASVFSAPTQHDPSRYGVVRIAFVNGWSSFHLDVFRKHIPALERIGPAFVEVDQHERPDVIVTHWDGGGSETGAAYYQPTLQIIGIDPVFTRGVLELQSAFAHEIGHHLGMNHIGRVGERGDFSPVGTGIAVMNTSLTFGDEVWSYNEAFTGLVPQTTWTALDLAEFRRARRARETQRT